jgi:predicted DNA-binding transcriptional regulator AlpA
MQSPALMPSISSGSLESEVFSLKSELQTVRRSLASLFLCAKAVQARYGFSRATLYRRLADGTIPKAPRYPGHVWRLADLEAAETAGRLPRPGQSPI